jgi:hypothetical protein
LVTITSPGLAIPVNVALYDLTRSASAAAGAAYWASTRRTTADDHMPCTIVSGRFASEAKYGCRWIGLKSREASAYVWFSAGATVCTGAARQR